MCVYERERNYVVNDSLSFSSYSVCVYERERERERACNIKSAACSDVIFSTTNSEEMETTT